MNKTLFALTCMLQIGALQAATTEPGPSVVITVAPPSESSLQALITQLLDDEVLAPLTRTDIKDLCVANPALIDTTLLKLQEHTEREVVPALVTMLALIEDSPPRRAGCIAWLQARVTTSTIDKVRDEACQALGRLYKAFDQPFAESGIAPLVAIIRKDPADVSAWAALSSLRSIGITYSGLGRHILTILQNFIQDDSLAVLHGRACHDMANILLRHPELATEEDKAFFTGVIARAPDDSTTKINASDALKILNGEAVGGLWE